jgi:hypothetical protein
MLRMGKLTLAASVGQAAWATRRLELAHGGSPGVANKTLNDDDGLGCLECRAKASSPR